MPRNGHRAEFVPNTEYWAPNTVEEQKEDHERYWDIQHDVGIAERLKEELLKRGMIAAPTSLSPNHELIEIVQELRLTTY